MQSRSAAPVPDRLLVLTFDDAVKSHRTVVAPLLKELGFGATFFVTHAWMSDTEHFMSWQEIAEIHQMGFEIGNHSWTHGSFSSPRNAARLSGQLGLVEYELRKAGVPRPVSFAYSGNRFGPEAVRKLAEAGYRFSRRGMQPEVEYGKVEVGSAFDPRRHHPLLIPSTADAYPNWTLEHFRAVAAQARNGQIVVVQFHGVPDLKHPWVHTPPERFREYMDYLKAQNFQVIALRDVEPYLDLQQPPADPLVEVRYSRTGIGQLQLPVEVEATRADLPYWLENMLRFHRYSFSEAAQVCGLGEGEVRQKAPEVPAANSELPPRERKTCRVLPYPGGRHPRLGFLEGSLDPHRGTKASVFLPWDDAGYVVIDLPEALFRDKDLIYLAHTHIPTIWDNQNILLDNIDWDRRPDGDLNHRRELPNGIAFGASIRPDQNVVAMELWLRNGTGQILTGLRTQICVLLKAAAGFNAQTNDNKIFRGPAVAVGSERRDRWILTAWERSATQWGQSRCPCMHSDPTLPDCAPGATVSVRGRLWFYDGKHIERELERVPALVS